MGMERLERLKDSSLLSSVYGGDYVGVPSADSR